MTVSEVLLRRVGDGSWAWRYRAEGAPDIVANRLFRTEEGAVASARLAYPGVPVRFERRAPRVGRTLLIAAAAGAVAAVALRRRRRTVRLKRVSAGPRA